ncbi:hypothetical protein ACO229_04555 [Promicromonospora sp. MS192]|uniref:hypothetical protein n=1 Tax=Promicromonospora sp. MS192 TaxID=3412684 RepID=UPI003C2BB32C
MIKRKFQPLGVVDNHHVPICAKPTEVDEAVEKSIPIPAKISRETELRVERLDDLILLCEIHSGEDGGNSNARTQYLSEGVRIPGIAHQLECPTNADHGYLDFGLPLAQAHKGRQDTHLP